MVVELQYKELTSNAPTTKRPTGPSQRSVFVGWTGMASTAKPTSIADRTGRRTREDSGVIEIDATFGRMLGLADGQKVWAFDYGAGEWLKQYFRWSFCYI